MTKIRHYGTGTIPGFDSEELPGRLIILEGTDGVGRSTQVALLHAKAAVKKANGQG